ncbi:MAG: hypothetical protein JWR52_1793 [Marmoricola sp.]|nr:hypothetical protein [Marmoricola sp.]
MTADGSGDRPASEVYWARIAVIDLDWLDRITRPLDYISLGRSPLNKGPEPKYRVLVGRHGRSHGVGVEVATNRRSANKRLAKVNGLLAASTVAEFTAQYDLGRLH